MTKKPVIFKKAEYHSITEAMLVSLGVSILIGLLVGIILKFGVDFIVQTDYLTDEKIEAREKESIKDLEDYVTHYDISLTDTKHIGEWVKSANFLYVLIYKDGELIFDSGEYYSESSVNDNTFGGLTPIDPDQISPDENDIHAYPGDLFWKMPTREELFTYTLTRNSYRITFKDTEAVIRVAEYSEYMYYALGNFLGILGAILSFLGFLIFRIHILSERIRKLGKDVIGVAAGDIEHEISVIGNDEVAELSTNIDNMRQSLVYSYKKQRDAQQANAELITAMSHDIRTPLTVLLGYIDMMKMKNDNEEISGYIQAAEHTALRLKRMSDDMFNYFRLFGGTELKTEPEIYPVSTLFSQLLEEYIFMLVEKGYLVNSNIEILNTVQGLEIETDAPQLARIVENIFSNILKYADKSAPVCIKLDLNSSCCKILFTNNVAKNLDNVESNNIGLKTCIKIANALNIKFNTENTSDVFTVSIVIPTYVESVPVDEITVEKGIGARVTSALRSALGFFKKCGSAVKDKIELLFRRK